MPISQKIFRFILHNVMQNTLFILFNDFLKSLTIHKVRNASRNACAKLIIVYPLWFSPLVCLFFFF